MGPERQLRAALCAGLAAPIRISSNTSARALLAAAWRSSSWYAWFLAPSRLEAMASVKLVALPFWQFEVEQAGRASSGESSVSATARVSTAMTGEGERGQHSRKSNSVRRWRKKTLEIGNIGKETVRGIEEVYAGYMLPPSVAAVVLDDSKHQNTFAEVFRIPEEARLTGLRPSESQDEYVFDEPCMSEDMAWSFVIRRMRQHLIRQTTRLVAGGNQEEYAAISCSFDLQRTNARLVAYPAFIFQYEFEKRYSQSGHVEDVPFTAVLGANTGKVSAVQHLCTNKTRIAGGLFGGLIASLYCGLSTPELSTIAADVLASATIFSLCAGTVATRAPIRAWTMLDSEREQEDNLALKGWESVRESVGYDKSQEPLDWREDESYSQLWEDIEWRRWAQPDEWFGWNSTQRKEWAEQMLQRHVDSERKRYEKRIDDAMAARQAEADAAREKRKREKYGDNAFSGNNRKQYAFDPNGYFALLGLDKSKEINVQDIKAAFRREALKLHPDMKASVAKTNHAADEAFQKLHHAYTELLKEKVEHS